MERLKNHLYNETSPYLLQHADNSVDRYPWGEEAFRKAKEEDKPIFLSIGYSTCHWCHVMAHESFEDEEIAELLNCYFVSIKVDKEERPDVDSIYMAVCQAFTGSGGWPTSIFLTADQKPFFAGTYYPKTSRHGMIGMRELLTVIHEKWTEERESLLQEYERVQLEYLETRRRLDEAEHSLNETLEEHKSTQTEFEKAQKELQRLAYSRQAEIDPDAYIQFLDGIETLTQTERKIFNYYLDGLNVKEIAETISVKESTVYSHNKNIYSKLGINSLKQLLRYSALMRQQEKEATDQG